MQFLLIIQVNPDTLASLTEEERTAIAEGQTGFMEATTASGELVGTHALADPSQTSVVRGRPGAMTVTDGPFVEAKEYMGGYYVVDVADVERAQELAASIPGTDHLPVEVRPVVYAAGYGLSEPS